MRKNTLKYWIGKVHLWLGLTSGLVVFIIAITGCIYAFQSEIQDLTQPYRFVGQQSKAFLPPSELKAIGERELPGRKIHAVLYGQGGQAAQVIFFDFEPNYHYYLVYVNPYTGAVLNVKNMERDFFQFILDGHFYLWLPAEIGQPVTASATLIFLVMLITGIVLWWPRNKNGVKQRFTIKWNARWRRKNYDLHNVLGFYVSFIAVILAATGLVWGFQWFASAYYTAAGGEKSLVFMDPSSDTTAVYAESRPAIDRVWDRMKREYPDAATLEVHIPENGATTIGASANLEAGTYWKTDYRYFDQYTLAEVGVDHIYGRLNQATAADKLMRMNYDIHVGAILGLPGKILAFLASLLCASLPVTGIYIWYGRNYKNEISLKKKSERRVENTLEKTSPAQSM
ncbi:MAG TPA: PepSY-associated TM helix domain-containing protein [Ohtaekwangia sp.]|nr:PepSY-associated TM helix domain-containing protein [Ohtaekwangia sp.]